MHLLVQSYLFLALAFSALALAVWALADAAVRPAPAFESADKRTKMFWIAMSGGAALLSLLAVVGAFTGLLFSIIAGVMAGVYLADVRPAVRDYRRGGSSPW
ncbi:DUF2516 family protein [Ruania suaedae]|uniref:DUF2516 family protein n=1 Tax=Ruania suaedae TaxID=2897774 RepID=UPI001E59DFAC|nr:DUF2516 family protein [Ruania suaedae]UFU02591.1 DUF2516 family protein [Ruania suaedae]